MEIPDPRQVYNGAQRDQAGDKSDIEVVPDTEDEATMPDPSTEVRDAMSSSTMDIEDEMSRRSIEVAVVYNSPAIGHGRSETMCSEVTTSEYQGLPATSQQRYDPMRKGEASSRHSRQSDSETSGISRQSIEVNAVIRSCATGRSEIMRSAVIINECERAPATAQQQYSSRHSSQFDSEALALLSGTVCRRYGRRPKLVHASRASSSIGGQRRLLDNVRAERTDAMTSTDDAY